MVAHAGDASTGEAEAGGGSKVQGQPGLQDCLQNPKPNPKAPKSKSKHWLV